MGAVLVAANVALSANNVLLVAPAPAKAIANVAPTASAILVQVTASVLLVALATVKEDANAATTAHAVLVAANVALSANNVLLAAPTPAKAVANVAPTASAILVQVTTKVPRVVAALGPRASVPPVTLAAVKEDANAATTARALLVAANVALRANNVLLVAPAPAKAVANVATTANARAALVSLVVSTNLPFLSAPSHWRYVLICVNHGGKHS